MIRRVVVVFALLVASLLVVGEASARPLTVGSKAFTEGVVLGEVVAQACRGAGSEEVRHLRGLGGSVVLFRALVAKEIDAYVEYTGTLEQELLHLPRGASEADLRAKLAELGIAMSRPLGFDNTYALAVREDVATKERLVRTSDLTRVRPLVFGLSHEIVGRADGFEGLRRAYGLVPGEVRAMDHDVAERALVQGGVDVTDVYTTDAAIVAHGLRVLADDRGYFPAYRAIVLYDARLGERAPACLAKVLSMEGRIDAETMRRMNADVLVGRLSEDSVAHGFAERALGIVAPSTRDTLSGRLVRRTLEHVQLSLGGLLLAMLVGLPLGVVCSRRPKLASIVLGISGVVQTVPSLALLVLLVPVLGIGTVPAVVALVVYSLFPVVEGTVTGLTTIDPRLVESADLLGLPRAERLRRVDLPLASPSIVSGVRTAAVLSVGTATLGAMVGAGGYGQPILTGVRLESAPTILEGAVPAALLSLLVLSVFRFAERRIVPRGLVSHKETRP